MTIMWIKLLTIGGIIAYTIMSFMAGWTMARQTNKQGGGK